MKTTAGNIATAGGGFTQRLFSRLKSVLCAPAETATGLTSLSGRSPVRSSALLMTVAMFVMVAASLFAPRTAEARPEFRNTVITIPYPASAQAFVCGNCHVNWGSNGQAYSSRIDWLLYNGISGDANLALTNTMFMMDSDNDGRTNGEEMQASLSSTRPAQTAASPNVALNWSWQIPDVDGDGCGHYFTRQWEGGTPAPTDAVVANAVVGTGDNYRRYIPRGWDMDDNDAAQGCSTGMVATPGNSGDNVKPGKVNTLSIAAAPNAVIPLKWVPVGDDGNGLPGDQTGGKAHSYEIRYTTAAFANGGVGRNPRSPADWEIMHNVPETHQIDEGTWSTVGDPTSLMQAIYEPRPDVPSGTTIQSCNARDGANATTGFMTCTAGASYDIKTRGTTTTTNVIVNNTTYWVAMWTFDGVTRTSGNSLTIPGTITEQATLSNIIAVTAGVGGAGVGISSYSPSVLTAPGSITVNGFQINATVANQLVLTNASGSPVATATGLTYGAGASSVTGNFATLPAAGTYNLELRTSAGVMKAAWVEAVTIAGGPTPPVITSPLTATGQVGTPFSYQITATNSPTSYGATPLPAGSPAFAVSATGLITGTPTTAGTTTTAISATNGGGTDTKSLVITINPAPPTIVACSPGTPPTSGQVGVSYSFTCTATGGTTPYSWSASGLPTSLSINSVTGEISGTPSVAGTFGPTINVTGGGTSSVPATIAIAKGNQTVTLSCPATLPVSGNGSCSATSSVGLTPFTYAASGDCTVNSTTGAVTAAAAVTTGNCSVTANQAGNDNYNPATSAPSSIAITKLNQTVTVTCPASLPVNGTGNCSASSTSGLTTFTFTVTAGACTINSTSGAVGAPGATGSCTITASQAGSGTYNSGSGSAIISINNLTPQTVTLTCPSTLAVSGTGTCSATSTSGLTTFTYAASGDCTVGVSTGAVTAAGSVTTGTCSVTASQAGNATFAPGTSAPKSIAITKLNQTVTLTCPASIPANGTGNCSATATSGLTSFTYAATGACTVNSTSGAVTAGATAGTCSVTATQAGNGTYNAATSAESSIAITKLNQTVTLTCPASITVSGTGTCSATATSGLTTFAYAATGACTINSTSGAVTAAATAGTCSVTASQAGDGTYNPATSASVSIAITGVDLLPQTVTVTCPGTLPVNGTGTCSASATSGLTTFTYAATGACTINSTSGAVTAAATAGTCSVTASQAGDATYASATSAPASITVTGDVDTTPPVITPNPLGGPTPFFGPLTVTLSSDEPDTTVFYTMNGTMPTTSSLSCAAPCSLTITRSTLLQYRGRDAAGNLSASRYQVYYIYAVDLVMIDVRKSATSVKKGASFSITNAARNKGTLGTTTPFKISFYLSVDKIITTADRKLTNDRPINGLAAKSNTTTVATSVVVPSATPTGVYYVGACVDSGNVVPEASESNNCKNAGSSSITGSATIKVTL